MMCKHFQNRASRWIDCDGITEGITTRLQFQTVTECREHFKAVCSSTACEACPYYEAAEVEAVCRDLFQSCEPLPPIIPAPDPKPISKRVEPSPSVFERQTPIFLPSRAS